MAIATFVVAACGAAYLVGWWSPDAPIPPEVVPTRARPPLEPLERPNEVTSGSLAYLRDMMPPPPAPVSTEPPKPKAPPPKPPPPPAPPPDIAVVFRQQVTALVRDPENGRLSVLLVEGGGPNRQVTRVGLGDAWRDGWRISALTTTSAVLRKGSEERKVSLYGSTGG
jgi:hypothetical protein